jgi:hypothetical protein
MRRTSLVVLLSLLVCASAFGQASQTVRVQAAVASVLAFTIDNGNGATPQIFNFGTVDATGTNPGNAPRVTAPVVDLVNGTASYTAAGAFNWAVLSAPRSTVTITSTASKTAGTTTVPDLIGRTSMGIGQLEMQWIATVTAATVTNTFTAMGAGPQTWLTGPVGTAAGGPAPRSNGTIDLRLTVDDLDLVEANEWTIVFTATSV